MNLRELTASRVRPDQPHTEHAIATINGLADVGDRLRALSERLDSDRGLTSVGRQSRLSETVRNSTMKEFAHASRAVRKALGRFEAQRAGLGLEQIDRTDPVGELRRQEIRAYVRSLPTGERIKIARDATFADALLDAPAPLSGLDADVHAKLRETRIRELHGPALRELDLIEQDYREAESVAVVIRNELQRASGLAGEAFEKTMRPLEDEADRS